MMNCVQVVVIGMESHSAASGVEAVLSLPTPALLKVMSWVAMASGFER